ncbi:hypothetical protein THER5_2017 [Bifidobacterium thermacidophilum subsp. thermacidophilum]|uniref:Uncharacterized protein n=1 Tax=Bifidobacterium thermacidophilum subsp. thermacidophilum TaxID=79262 RepID=A0A087E1L8_9BIFI|nr:hypothetical protein THER5_2017 [Bifidobacterium thermacidophilum subsp. thermacidophilum]
MSAPWNTDRENTSGPGCACTATRKTGLDTPAHSGVSWPDCFPHRTSVQNRDHDVDILNSAFSPVGSIATITSRLSSAVGKPSGSWASGQVSCPARQRDGAPEHCWPKAGSCV